MFTLPYNNWITLSPLPTLLGSREGKVAFQEVIFSETQGL
jgi:hypothetical protein